jgi:hypothetical protein
MRVSLKRVALVGVWAALCGASLLVSAAGAVESARLPVPSYGRTVNLIPVGGTVGVRLPGAGAERLPRRGLQVPLGTVVDTRSGRVRLTSARSTGGSLQTADFFSGRFEVLQTPTGPPVTVAKLVSEPACGHRGRPGAAASRSSDDGLWGSGHGSFRTQGRHGSATVRGTIWWVQNRCDGTLFRVKRGVVTIRDFTKHTTVIVRQGSRYLAPAAR